MDEFCLKVFYSFWLLNSRVMEESTFASGAKFVRKFTERRKKLSERLLAMNLLTGRRHRTVFETFSSEDMTNVLVFFRNAKALRSERKAFRNKAPQIRIHLRPSEESYAERK